MSDDTEPDAIERAMSGGRLWLMMVRYGRGDLTPGELALVERWAAGDPSRERFLHGIERLGALSRRAGRGGRTEAAWERMRSAMARAEQASTPPLRLHTTAPMPGFARYAAPSVRRHLRRVAIGGAIAAGLAALAVAGRLVLDRGAPMETAAELREAAAPRGGRAVLGLPDGTRVVLGPASRIRHAVTEPGERRVYLEGVALFDVARDSTRPFVVHAAGGAAQAVGTAFTVRAYPEDSAMAVVVAEGRVALRAASGAMGSGTMIEPGQRGVLGASGLVRLETGVDLARELGWTEGRLVYDRVPLSAVLRDLERWFDVRVVLGDPSWAQDRITVVLDASSADASFRRLATVLDTHYTPSAGEVRIGP